MIGLLHFFCLIQSLDMKLFFPLLLLFIIISSMKSQGNFDCTSALEVSNFEDINFKTSLDAIGSEQESVNESCTVDLIQDNFWEEDTYWFKYVMNEDGCFTFVLSAEETLYDMDFVLYKADQSDCESLLMQRCMLSGESVGLPGNEPCLGPTGLQNGESDVSESVGCIDGSNNFLAPLTVEANDNYYLAVRVFSELDSFNLAHDFVSSTACVSSLSDLSSQPNVTIYPNPVGNQLFVSFKTPQTNKSLSIYDYQGRLINREAITGNKNFISVAHLDKGFYFVLIEGDAFASTLKFIKN